MREGQSGREKRVGIGERDRERERENVAFAASNIWKIIMHFSQNNLSTSVLFRFSNCVLKCLKLHLKGIYIMT